MPDDTPIEPVEPDESELAEDDLLEILGAMPSSQKKTLLRAIKESGGAKGLVAKFKLSNMLEKATGRRPGSVAGNEVSGTAREKGYGRNGDEYYDPAKDDQHPDYERLKAAADKNRATIEKAREMSAKGGRK